MSPKAACRCPEGGLKWFLEGLIQHNTSPLTDAHNPFSTSSFLRCGVILRQFHSAGITLSDGCSVAFLKWVGLAITLLFWLVGCSFGFWRHAPFSSCGLVLRQSGPPAAAGKFNSNVRGN